MGKNEVEIIVTAEDKASPVFNKIGGALKGIGTVATGVAVAGIGALAAGFGLAVGEAINMNATLETSTLQFETLMGDADKAEAHVKSLFDFAAKTPFETGPIIEASRVLQVFGGDALNTTENLTLVGDTAAAVGAPIEDIGFWVGRAYAAIQGGQPFGEAAQNLMQMGAVSPEVISRMNELKEAGAGPAEIFAVLQEHMGGFTGAMEKQSGTWSGMMSTLKDSVSMAAAEGLKPFFDLAKEGLGWLVNSGIIDRVAVVFGNIATKISELVPIITSFIKGLMSGEDPIGDIANLAWELATAFGATDEQAKKIFMAIVGLRDKFEEVVQPIITAVANFVSFKDVLIALGIAIAAAVIPAIISMVVAMAPILLTIGAVIAVVALLRSAWENNFAGIQEKTQVVIEFIKGFIQNALVAIQAFWKAHGEEIMAVVRQAWDTIKIVVETVIEAISFVIKTFVTVINQLWEAHGEEIMKVAKWAWESIMALIKNILDGIQLIAKGFMALFKGDWETFKENIIQVWKNTWDTVVKILSNLWSMVLPWLTSLWNNIKSWWDGIDWGMLGRNLVNKIVSGIQSIGSSIVNVLMGFAKAAWDAVIGFFKGSANSEASNATSGGGGNKSSQSIGNFGNSGFATSSPTGRATAGKTTIINIDARGAARGVDRDLRQMVFDILREQGLRADVRMRTGY